MIPSSIPVLHGGLGVTVAPADYLVRVLLHLLAVGGFALLVYSVSNVAGAVRSLLSAD